MYVIYVLRTNLNKPLSLCWGDWFGLSRAKYPVSPVCGPVEIKTINLTVVYRKPWLKTNLNNFNEGKV